MLIVRTVAVREHTHHILINPNECEFCRRTKADCAARPWRNHSFTPASARADAVPARWQMLARIPEDEAPNHRLNRSELADVVPLRKDTLI